MKTSELFEDFYDARHEKSDLPYFGYEKESGFIDPSDGFYFTSYNGDLVFSSTNNENYSAKVANIIVPNHWNQFSGMVNYNARTVTISKENYGNGYAMRQRNIFDVKAVKNTFRKLLAHGLDVNYKITGLPPEFPKTIKGFLELRDPTDDIITQQSVVLYHGTSLKRWVIIKKQGLRSGNTPDVYNDLVDGYSEKNVYLAYNPKGAEFYGKRQAAKDRDTAYVIIQVTVPDPAKIIPDDRYAAAHVNSGDKFTAYQYKSGRSSGEVAYRGNILPRYLELYSTKKFTGKHVDFVKGDRVSDGRRTGTVTQVYNSTSDPFLDIQLDDGKFLKKIYSDNRWYGIPA